MKESRSKKTKVGRRKLEACMTCPLCNLLFNDATTISECLHTFCKRCIYEKITEEDLNSCPVCKVSLGCSPLEKLRVDNTLQGLISILFAPKIQDVVVVEPPKMKEKTLSSLAVAVPRRSLKSLARRKRSINSNGKKEIQQEAIMQVGEHKRMMEDSPRILSLHDTYCRYLKDTEQNLATAYKKLMQSSSSKKVADTCDQRVSLNCLVQAAKGTESKEIHMTQNHTGALPDLFNNGVCLSRGDNSSCALKTCNNDLPTHVNGNVAGPVVMESMAKRICCNGQPKKASLSKELAVATQTEVRGKLQSDEYHSPIWLSLVASQERNASLPQIRSRYLRIRDEDMPVSYIKRYLAMKLGLASEAEVEIYVRGQPVIPTLRLRSLMEWWIQTAPATEMVHSFVGSSAKEYLMVISYSRRVQPAEDDLDVRPNFSGR